MNLLKPFFYSLCLLVCFCIENAYAKEIYTCKMSQHIIITKEKAYTGSKDEFTLSVDQNFVSLRQSIWGNGNKMKIIEQDSMIWWASAKNGRNFATMQYGTDFSYSLTYPFEIRSISASCTKF